MRRGYGDVAPGGETLENNDHEEARMALKIEDKINRMHIEMRQNYAMRLGRVRPARAAALSSLISL